MDNCGPHSSLLPFRLLTFVTIMPSQQLETAAAVSNVTQLGLEALAPPTAAAFKWIRSRHPDARIEKWMERIDPVMRSVRDSIHHIPDSEMAIFNSFVDRYGKPSLYCHPLQICNHLIFHHSFFDKTNQLEALAEIKREKGFSFHIIRAISAWNDLRKAGDRMAVVGHAVIRTGHVRYRVSF